MFQLQFQLALLLLVLSFPCFSASSSLDILSRAPSAKLALETLDFGCSPETVVRPGDAEHLRQVLETTPSGCTVRLTGNYMIRSPLKVNHRLVSTPSPDVRGDWFAPFSFAVIESADANFKASQDPLEDNTRFYFPGFLGQSPGAVLSPEQGYIYTNLVILGELGSMEHIGLDNKTLLTTDQGCQATGLELEAPWLTILNRVSLSTILNLCLPSSQAETVSDLPNTAFTEPEDGETTNTGSSSATTSGSNIPEQTEQKGMLASVYEQTIWRRMFQKIRGRGDDEDDPQRQQELERSHYSDVIDWEERLKIIEAGDERNEKRQSYQKINSRSRTYQKVGSILFLSGITAGGMLLSRFGIRGVLNPPWPNLHYRTGSNSFRHFTQANWIYVPGLIVAAIAQGPVAMMISVPRQNFVQERLDDLEKENGCPAGSFKSQ